MSVSRFTALLLFILTSPVLFAQTKSAYPWHFISEGKIASKEKTRLIVPQAYLTANMDVQGMKAMLVQAPLWRTPEAETQAVVIALPMPNGGFERFQVVEAPIMHPDLQAKYPDIRAYAGRGIDDPTAYFRGDFTPKGFHGMVRSPEHSTVFIDPYSTDDIAHYIVYYKKDFVKNDPWQCDFDNVHQEKPKPATTSLLVPIGDCVHREYTLALACTGEYATFHGGNTGPVLAAMTTTMVRVNGVFEQDASIHMTLHPNTDTLIFLNASTDPYTNTDGSAMLAQNQTTCDARIGNANYDIGHVFSTGGGGVAYLGAVCTNSLKAGGVTGQPNPIGDAFDIDYVAHEMGHQYGANHTQNNNCNRNSATAMEPGSASTIMGYAGICSPNVQNNSDDYFHAISLQEMAAEVTSNGSGGGNTCSTNTTVNSTPTANAGADYVIPRSTPFILTGTATDPNEADVLTYTWEQTDFAVATMPPVSTNTGGPAFRSFKGTTSPSRYVPRLTDVVNNVNPTWEVLPSVARTLNWRLVVRDNHVGGGCAAQDNMVVTVNGTAGPFLVTSPNTNVNWPATSMQTVTWDVAGTTASPVSCANVDILLSVDGGLTYPHVLATATPNDGSQSITLPNLTSSTARIMVRANGNIFYDISNTNFTISPAVTDFNVSVSPTSQTVCPPNNGVFTVTVGATGGFTGNVTLSVTGVPSGATSSFSVNPVAAPGTSTLTIGNTSGAAPGTYTLTITGVNGSNSRSTTATLLLGQPAQTVLSTPANLATAITLNPTLTWGATGGAATYNLQVSTSSVFSTTVVNATGLTSTSYNVATALTANTTYFWRVAGVNTCGTGTWSWSNSFTTYSTECVATLASTDVPKTIASTGTPTVTSTLSISGVQGNLVGIKVKDLKIHHSWIGDIKATLTAPNSTSYILFDRPGNPASNDGCSQNHILATFDDAATLTAAQFESTCNTSAATTPPPYAITGTYQPVNVLAPLSGISPNGTWTLTVQDFANGDGGSIQTWSLEIITSCETKLNLTQTFIEGFVSGSSMQPVLMNSSVDGSTPIQADSVTVALHAAVPPYAQVYSKDVVLSTTGTAIPVYPKAATGNSYYIVVKGRNLIETWSANPVAFTNTTNYNFGSAAQAYGNNLGLVGSIPVIYSGDIDSVAPDGEINLLDYSIWEIDNENGEIGYRQADLNGDGEVNLIDYAVWEINNSLFILSLKP